MSPTLIWILVLVFFVIGSFYKYGQAQALKNSGVVTSFAGLHLTKLELIEGNGDLAPRHVLAGLTARVEDSGTLNRRITATRLLAVGVFALAIKKKQDDREVYLTIEGPTTAILRAVAFKVNPKAGEDARRFAAQLNLFSRTTALRPTAVPVPADGVPDAEPPVAAGPFDVTLINAGDKKIQVIKVVREAIPGIGLKEAKDLVEAAPIMLTQLPTENEALRVQASLERAGASVLVNAATV